MQTVEERAREALNAVSRERGNGACWDRGYRRKDWDSLETVCLLLEEFDTFKQDVSDAVEKYLDWAGRPYVPYIDRLIIPKPVDPLVDVMAEVNNMNDAKAADDLRAALAKRGLKIVEADDA